LEGLRYGAVPRPGMKVFILALQEVAMTDGFEERKKKNEEKWAHDEQIRFKALARRNKLFGRRTNWV
jgi:hypothetical protein